MNLIEELMQSLMKPLREAIMKNKNGLIDKVNSIDINIEKLERSSIKNSDQVGLIWLTLLGYIIYLEFFK
jgi:hypothetical protein